ncbi:hypothetical protein [Pseudoalteromonas sp. MMG005]|uniref:hypothetical protein n=1 Tax=Pseudoalteromonas sp. MMG005 TaxID=2822682 RepID=UPI001B39D6D9|nr:hypothetical protein [Pseudoalteromonas sp. MMG005]MBQ4845371.1 hypothetical protein [Pseudoalteromonas sp. MMG005]
MDRIVVPAKHIGLKPRRQECPTKTRVIAISGASGAGKTSVIKKLAQQFDAPYLLFDSYVDNDTYPANMKRWFADGANVSLIHTPKFTLALKHLAETGRHRYIFVEEPFGRQRCVMDELIESVVLLDIPLELCLSRVVRRHTSAQSIDSLAAYLDKYEDYFRDIYCAVVEQVRSNSDLVMNDVQSLDITVNRVRNWLLSVDTKISI